MSVSPVPPGSSTLLLIGAGLGLSDLGAVGGPGMLVIPRLDLLIAMTARWFWVSITITNPWVSAVREPQTPGSRGLLAPGGPATREAFVLTID